MRLDRAFQLCSILLVLISVTAHEIGAEGYVYLLIAVAIGVFVFRQTILGKPVKLNEKIATFICLGAFAMLAYHGFRPVSRAGLAALDVGVVPVGDFLTIFQCVYLCREKHARDYFWMFLVTLVQMGTAGLLTPGVLYALFFIPYTALALCAISLFHVWNEVTGSATAILPPLKLADRPVRQLRIPGMSLLAVFPATLAVIVSISLLFVLMPRRPPSAVLSNPLGSQLVRATQPQVAGFSPTVDFQGARGRIYDNPATVMHVTLRNPANQAIQMDQLLMRGVALDEYAFATPGDSRVGERKWSWHTGKPPPRVFQFAGEGKMPLADAYSRNFPGFFTSQHQKVLCEVVLEPLGTNIIFAPFAPESLVSREKKLFLIGERTQHIIEWRGSTRSNTVSYSVTSRLFDPAPPPKMPEETVSERILGRFLALPELAPRLKTLAQQIVSNPPAQTDYVKAQRILQYLTDPAKFSYTNEEAPTAGVEPVEDFLFNLHKGHCEYFASAMAVLLREVNVPSRVVTGYKLSEYNTLNDTYIVRQQNAHSWVEAFLRPYGWRTFDPSGLRSTVEPTPSFTMRFTNDLTDVAETLWVTYVLNYDSDRQQDFYGGLFANLEFLDRLVGREVRQPWERQGFIPVVRNIVLIAIALISVAAVITILARLFTKSSRGSRSSIAFYDKMEKLLERRGYRRRESQTPWEFYRDIEPHFSAKEEVGLITARFCEAKYGGSKVQTEELKRIAAALRTIGNAAPKRRQPTSRW